MNRLVPVPVPPSVLVTTTFFAPAVPLGVTQVMVVAFVKLGLVQVEPPTVAVIPEAKLVPVMVMVVPPVSLPTAGETAVTVGVEVTLNVPWPLNEPPSGLVTETVCAPTVAFEATFTLKVKVVPAAFAVVVLELVTSEMPEPLKVTVAPV